MAKFEGDGTKQESVGGGTKFSHGDEAKGRAETRKALADGAMQHDDVQLQDEHRAALNLFN